MNKAKVVYDASFSFTLAIGNWYRTEHSLLLLAVAVVGLINKY
jgi:hypothetical protein